MTSTDQLRTALERKFQPPIDVLLDPSLLTAKNSLNRLADSRIFESQTQATLGQQPTKPRLGEVYIPKTFRTLLEGGAQRVEQKTTVWDFFRGQAEGSSEEDITVLLDQNDVETFAEQTPSPDLFWANALGDANQRDQLSDILGEVASFLRSGGILLARTSVTLETLRDAGVPTIDVGNAELVPKRREVLSDIGYESPAHVCAFGVSTADSTVNALVGNILASHSDLLLYRVST